MSNEGGCCGGGRKQSDSSQPEATNTQPCKDDNALAKAGLSPADKTKTASTSAESPAPKTPHGSCCG